MSDAYQATVQIYVRKLEKATSGLRAQSKEAKALNDLCKALNLDATFKDHKDLVPFLARLRALDMVQGPM